MLKLRVASALALAAVVIAAVTLLPPPWLAAFFHLLGLVAIREWAKLSGIVTRVGWIAYASLVSALVVALWLAREAWQAPAVSHGFLVLAGVFWIAGFAVVWSYPRSMWILRSKVFMVALGALVVPGAWLALITLATLGSRGAYVLIWLLAAVAAADIAAYFAGRRFGRRKLAPEVSPGKTWEGVAGGALAALAWGVCGAWFFAHDFGASLPGWLGATAVLIAASVVGDLFESAFKRSRGVKDSGSILPGHGGILDRIDALLAAAPAFALLAPALVLQSP